MKSQCKYIHCEQCKYIHCEENNIDFAQNECNEFIQ